MGKSDLLRFTFGEELAGHSVEDRGAYVGPRHGQRKRCRGFRLARVGGVDGAEHPVEANSVRLDQQTSMLLVTDF